MKATEENKREVFCFYLHLNLYFYHVKRRNRIDIAAEETVGTDSSKHILEHLENSEIRQQEKLDKKAGTFKSGLTGLTETLVDIFKTKKQGNRFI